MKNKRVILIVFLLLFLSLNITIINAQTNDQNNIIVTSWKMDSKIEEQVYLYSNNKQELPQNIDAQDLEGNSIKIPVNNWVVEDEYENEIEKIIYLKAVFENNYELSNELTNPIIKVILLKKLDEPKVEVSQKLNTLDSMISWDSIENANEYEIYRSVNNKEETLYKRLKETSFIDSSLEIGSTYSYRVKAIYSSDDEVLLKSDFSSIKDIKIKSFLNKFEINVNQVKNEAAINVTWSKQDNADGYNIYKYDPSKKDYLLYKTIVGTNFVDTNVKINDSFYYKVSSYKINNNKIIESELSDNKYANIKNPLSTPSSPVLKQAYSKSGVTLKWDVVVNATSYQIYKYNSRLDKYVLFKTTTTNSFLDEDPKTNQTYCYKIVAVRNSYGKNIFSTISKFSKIKIVNLTPAKPKAPTLKQAYYKSGVRVSWKAVENANVYQVYKYNTRTKKYVLIKTTKSTSFTDVSPEYRQTYHYKIKAGRIMNNKTTYSSLSSNTKIKIVNKTPNSARLRVSWISQLKGKERFDAGCEVTSLAIVLNYNNFNVSKENLYYNYLVKQKSFYGKYSFDQAYLGTINSSSKWGGAYQKPIIDAANKYLKEIKSYKRAYDISGSSLDRLYQEIDAKRPVIVWSTMNMQQSNLFLAGKTTSGKKIYWQDKSHTMVITGYDRKKDLVYVSDPLSGNVSYKKSVFEKRYNQVGKRAIIIK